MDAYAAQNDAALGKWPLPLAQLFLRAQNGKNPLERHHAAYFVWEAALKLLGSVAIVEYAGLEARDRDDEHPGNPATASDSKHISRQRQPLAAIDPDRAASERV